MGFWGGLVIGVVEMIEYVVIMVVIVYFLVLYVNGIISELFGFELLGWFWYFIFYIVFIVLNFVGVVIFFWFVIIVLIILIGIILVFFVMVIFFGVFSWDVLWDIVFDFGQMEFLLYGVLFILFVLLFVMWFFLGIEEFLLVVEELYNLMCDILKVGFWVCGMFIVMGLFVFFLNIGVIGVEVIGIVGELLFDGFCVIVGDQFVVVLVLFVLIGLFVLLQGIMFVYGCNMYLFFCVGYYLWFFFFIGKWQMLWVVFVIGVVIGFVVFIVFDVLVVVDVEGVGLVVGVIVLNIVVWGVVFVYGFQLILFMILWKKYLDVDCFYCSFWGIFGVVVVLVIVVFIFVGFLLNLIFGLVIIVIVIVYVVILFGFGFFFWYWLVFLFEEEYVILGGLYGDLQVEGYDVMEDEVFDGGR